jgi:hypothetical protein
MRRSGLAAVITGALLVVACSEQPTAPTERPISPPPPSFAAVCTSPTTTCIQNLINALFPKGDLLKSANDLWANIKTKVAQGNKGLPAAQAKATDLVNFGLKNFYAKKLLGGSTADNLIAMTDAVYKYAGLTTNTPGIPPGSLSPDGAAAVLGPQSPTTLVITGTKQAGVLVPAGAAGTTTVVSINRLPNSPGPLLTTLDQFPLFYQYTTTPEITFGQNVITSVCQSQDFEPYGILRLAHNFRSDGGVPVFGDVEILPRVAPAFALDCSNAAAPLGALDQVGPTNLASEGWRLLGRMVVPVAKAIFLPDELHAAALLGTCCLTGSGTRFSPHGAVNPNSNPGTFGTVDENGEPTDGQVSGPGTVYVKTTSQNGAPIQKVPVTFDGETTVLTDGNGIASFVWDATPGTTLTATVPDETTELGPSCPSGSPESPPNTKYRPLVCFTPSSVTFTAPAAPPPGTDIVVVNDLNIFDNPRMENAGNQTLVRNLVTYTHAGPRGAGTKVWIDAGRSSQCAVNSYCTVSGLSGFTAQVEAEGVGMTVTLVSSTPGFYTSTSIPSDVKVVFLWTPRDEFSLEEVNTFKQFAAEGGRLVFVGENSLYYSADDIAMENKLMTDLGAQLTNTGAMIECGSNPVLPEASIRAHQITTDVTSLGIACASSMTLGPQDFALFFDTSNQFVLSAVARINTVPTPIVTATARVPVSASMSSARVRASSPRPVNSGVDAATGQPLPGRKR